jgi:hypothetical protein
VQRPWFGATEWRHSNCQGRKSLDSKTTKTSSESRRDGTPKIQGSNHTPAEIKGTRHRVCLRKSDPAKVSTSMVERSNHTLRMRCRRFTRLNNAKSMCRQNHEAAIALVFMAYNFVTIHSTLKTTPAVQHGLADHPWSIVKMLDVLKVHE